MVSDILHQALADISEYLDERPSLYEGATRAKIHILTDHMAEVLKMLDTPPGTEREPMARNEA